MTRLTLIAASCLLATTVASARDISTTEVAELSLSFDCLDYRIVGVCFYVVCTGLECHIETTARISHFLPDVVVSSYHRTAHNPWGDVAGLANVGSSLVGSLFAGLAGAGVPTDGGHQREGRARADHENVRFKETDAIGNPLASTTSSFSEAGYLCKSDATSFMPYFLSTVDGFAWRSGITELIYPASYIPGLREIGHWPGHTWGSVHPRQGFLNTSEDPKAAAVCAQRAADIITRQSQPHVYQYLGGGDCGTGCALPGPAIETSGLKSKWQMLRPIPTSRCEVFGQDDRFGVSWADNQQIDETEDYAWNLWRRYRCCIPNQMGVYIGHVEFQ